MAALQERNGSYRILFRYRGKQHTFTLGKVPEREANNWAASVDQILLRVEQNLLHVPPGTDIVSFVKNGGKAPELPAVAAAAREPVTFATFKEKYLATHRGGMEDNSLQTVAMHLGHFEATLGPAFPLRDLHAADLQRHIDRRKQKKHRGKRLSAVTLKKETASFRAAWNWATVHGLVGGVFPSRGLVYPKADEKPPFQTWAEIERKIRRGGLTEGEQEELWDALYLRKEEIDQLLAYVRGHAAHPWIYPFFCAAAHTGARRSELLRLKVTDVDFAGDTILVHEKKRSRGKRTTRHVPLTPFLKNVLEAWVAAHPGGPYLFCHRGEVFRSKKRSKTTGHQWKGRATTLKGRAATVRRREQPVHSGITRDEAHDHFKQTLAGGKWEVLRGLHCLRHSYISCLAAAGVDQRIIDDAVGHQTDEQRRRYRHLVPDVKHRAVAGVFG
jgi:integrase